MNQGPPYPPPPSQGYAPGPQSWAGGPQAPPPGPPPKKTNWGLIVGLSLLGLLVVGFGSCAVCVAVVGSAGSKTTKSDDAPAETGRRHHRPQKDPEHAAKVAAQFVEIKKLLADYKANEVHADELYRGKYIKTKGKVHQISKGIGDGVYVVLEGPSGNAFETVHCTPGEDSASRAGSLKVGQMLQVGGKVRGYLLLSVMLDECEW